MSPSLSPFVRSVALLSTLAMTVGLAACSSGDGLPDPTEQQDAAADVAPDVDGGTIDSGHNHADTGAPDTGKDTGSPEAGEAGTDSGPSDGGDADADAGPTSPRFALFVGSDYKSKAVLSAIALTDSPSVAGSLSSADQDSVVASSASSAFFLHRTDGTVSILSSAEPWKEAFNVDVNPLGDDAGKANPWAVLVPAGDKAYVVRYAQNSLAVVNTKTGVVTGTVDLSSFLDAGDSDGLVDAFGGVYDPDKKLVYVGLQRINQNDWGSAPDYVGACTHVDALVVGIDPANDTVVDLNGSAEGKALHMKAANPSTMILDGDRLVVLGVGCSEALGGDAGTTRRYRGVEAIDLKSGAGTWLWQTQQLDRPGALVWMSSSRALVRLDDASFVSHWYDWDPSTNQLGGELSGVPLQPVWAGAFGLLGLQLSPAAGDAGSSYSLVRYDPSTGKTDTLLADIPALTGLKTANSAILR